MGAPHKSTRAMGSRVGDAIPDDVRNALRDLAKGSEQVNVVAPEQKRRLPGMLQLEPQKLATAVARMNRRRVDQTRTTLSNALEIAVTEHGDSLTPGEILGIVKRVDALLDVIQARYQELERLEEAELESAKLRARKEVRQRARQKKKAEERAGQAVSSRTGTRKHLSQGRPHKARSEPRQRSAQAPRRSAYSISRLYANLNHLKLQALQMDADQRREIRQRVLAELHEHRRQAHTFVRPDSALEVKANAVLAVLSDNRSDVARSWSVPSESPAPLKSHQMIYRARGRVVSGGLPGLGRR